MNINIQNGGRCHIKLGGINMTEFLNSCAENECGCANSRRCGFCLGVVLYIFSVFFALGIGLIFGVFYAETILVALPALIASTIILFILAVVTLIYKICIKNN